MLSRTNLFEYQNKESFKDNFEDLEIFLDDIWNKREKTFPDQEELNSEVQKFIQFIHKTKELRSNKYVGVIHYNDKRINLLPKIFYDKDTIYNETQIEGIQKHILWYLSYCRKLKFPNYQTSLKSIKNDFFEVMIYLFAKYTRELLNKSIYQQYEDINRDAFNIKGRLNTSQYINNNISRGKWHKINCDYDAFIVDNKFNRIIKYVSNLLFNTSKNQENKKLLREILFLLDDVSDETVSADDCKTINFNPMFGEFETVRDYCKLFLENSISISYKNELKLFAFLLPMEYLFEDFVFGFIDKKINKLKVSMQNKQTYLDENKTFILKPDGCISSEGKKFIADTKYKIIYSDENDSKNGVSEKDLYQMIAYAIRFNIPDIVLLYPNTIKKIKDLEEDLIKISDELTENNKTINIKIAQLPIIDTEILNNLTNNNICLKEYFQNLEMRLIERLEKIFVY